MKVWFVILIFLILFVIDSFLAKWNFEGFEVSGEVKPVILFMYGRKSKDEGMLRKQFKDNYKEYVGYLDVQEWNGKNAKEMKFNPKVDYEIRFYPNGLSEKENYTLYTGKLGDPLNDYIKELETKQEDIVEGSGGGVDALASAGKDQKGKEEDDEDTN